MRRSVGRPKAKRKVGAVKKTRRARSRSRKLGAATDFKGMIMKLIGLGSGVLLGRVGNNFIVKVAPGFSPLLSGFMQMAGGYIVASGSKNPFIDDVADGLMGGGFSVTIVSLASGSPLASVINGPNEGRSSYSYNRMAGPTTRLGIGGAQLSMVAGAQLPAVAGLPNGRRVIRANRDSMVG